MRSEITVNPVDTAKMTQYKTTDETNISVYRYKLEPQIVAAVTRFAKVHQFDARPDYKNAWNIWCEEETEMIERERCRLASLGYEGDVLDKMYKAGRYYFRTKKLNEDKKPKLRRHYVSMDSTILHAMDDHIRSHHDDDVFTPAQGYNWFVSKNTTLLMGEIKRLLEEESDLKSSHISRKVKKTYKNRYYLYSSNNN